MRFNKVQKALDRLDSLQDAHMTTFATDVLPDLEEQMAQRKQGFDDLEKAMTDLMSSPPATDDLTDNQAIKEMIAQIRVLMHQNMELSSRVQHHRDGLEKSMHQIKKSRKAIHAYGSPILHSNSPKVINFKN